MSDIKIIATHFAKDVGVVYMASRQEIIFFRPAVVKFTIIYFFSSEHHLTLLLPFLPLMVDSSSGVYVLRRNLQRNWVVGCQVEVKNCLTFVYCVDCVR